MKFSDFFFLADCPGNVTDDTTTTTPAPIEDLTYRSCDCNGDQIGLELQYIGDDTVSIDVTRLKKGKGSTYATFKEVVNGDKMTVEAGAFVKFKNNAGVKVIGSNGDTVCTGSVKSCKMNGIGEDVKGCEGVVTVVSFTSGDGALCDSVAVAGTVGGGATQVDNALINNELKLSNPFQVCHRLCGEIFLFFLCFFKSSYFGFGAI